MAKAKPKPTKPTIKQSQRFGGWAFGEITNEEGLTKATFGFLLAPGQGVPTSAEGQRALGADFFRFDSRATARRAEQLLRKARISPTADSPERRANLSKKVAEGHGPGSTHHLAALVLCAIAELREFREQLEQAASQGPIDPTGIRQAFELHEQLGASARELEWKLDNEKHAIQGKGSERGRLKGQAKGTESSKVERRQTAAPRDAALLRRKAEMRERRPKRSVNSMAQQLAREFPIGVSQITRIIRDPKK